MIEKAYGKINLSIDVVGERADGYHLLDMIMLPIDVYDELEIEIADEDSYHSNSDLPYNQRHIVYKTIEKLRGIYGFKEHFSIKLTKRIPMEAGLAGGSSDGAATIRILNKLLKLNMSLDEMLAFGASIGADVPYCIVSKPARVQGIGEIVREIYPKKDYKILLVKPETGVNTKEAFEQLNYDNCLHPSMDKLEKAFVEGKEMTYFLGNSLEESARRLNPDVAKIIDELKGFGFKDSLMSGSGSTCFCIVDGDCDLSKAYSYFKERYPFVAISQLNCKKENGD